MSESQPLINKVAVVTGAAKGIGAAVSENLARDGAHTALIGRDVGDNLLGGRIHRREGRARQRGLEPPVNERLRAKGQCGRHFGPLRQTQYYFTHRGPPLLT